MRNEHAGHSELSRKGFNLRAVFDPVGLPNDIRKNFIEAGFELGSNVRVVLIGMGGDSLWSIINQEYIGVSDPFDECSIYAAKEVSKIYWDDPNITILYPGNHIIPLQKLGELAGWSYPSPLGIGIHPKYGTWFAYRAAFLIDAPLQVTEPESHPSPCEICVDKPCINAYPAGALDSKRDINLRKCIGQRLSESSDCATRCHSRMACPVGLDTRYSSKQIEYHGSRSLESIKQWSAE